MLQAVKHTVRKCDNISKMVQDREVVTTDHE